MCLLRKSWTPFSKNLLGRRKPSRRTGAGALTTTDTTAPPITLATSPVTQHPEHRLGMHVVHDPQNPQNAEVVSIIFVHGLGGSATGTWTHSNTSFWPAWLHEEDGFENTRIATFGYNADYKNVFAPRNLLGIADFSKELLDAMDLHYDRYGDVVSVHVHD